MKGLTTLAATATLAAALAGTASATPFGQHVAMCAHELGARSNAPAITCAHDGVSMPFATFGAMVAHMREMH